MITTNAIISTTQNEKRHRINKQTVRTNVADYFLEATYSQTRKELNQSVKNNALLILMFNLSVFKVVEALYTKFYISYRKRAQHFFG